MRVLICHFLLIGGVFISACAGGKSEPSPLDFALRRDITDAGNRADINLKGDRGPIPPDSFPTDISGDMKAVDLSVDLNKVDAVVADKGAPDIGNTETCANGVDEDGDGLTDCMDIQSCGYQIPCVDVSRSLILYEVYPGTPDYIVVRNASTTARSTAGYKLVMYGTSTETVTLPAVTLASGQSVRLVEDAVGAIGEIGLGRNIPFFDGLANRANAIVLYSPGGAVIDYAGFGNALAGLPAGISQDGGAVPYSNYSVSSQSHYRAGMQGAPPTLKAADWLIGTKSK